jgi:hypothetical protein
MNGNEITASASYQLAYSSIFGQSTGKLNGMTMQKQFVRVLEQSPPHLFISSWNEFLAQPQPNPYIGRINTGYSLGLDHDVNKAWLFVDTYGVEMSRDIEPNVDYGDFYLQLMTSCIRMYRNGQKCSTDGHKNETTTAELCCDRSSWSLYANVWSLNYGASDFLLTTSSNERDILKKSGWHDNCSPFTGVTDFCVDTSITDGTRAPFIVKTRVMGTATISLYRCLISGSNHHLISLSSSCDGIGRMESLIGYLHSSRTSDSARPLYRCYDASKHIYYHSVTLPCSSSITQLFLGYVR